MKQKKVKKLVLNFYFFHFINMCFEFETIHIFTLILYHLMQFF